MKVRNNSSMSGEIIVLSVGHAHELARGAIARDDYNTAMEIGRIVLESDEIIGDADDYHNLSIEYSRKDAYQTAFLIVQKGLRQFPYNIDLLSDLIYYGSNAGKYEECENSVQLLLDRPMFLWNWRAYSFLIDYFIEKTDYWTPPANGEGDVTSQMGDPYFSLFNSALRIAEKFQEMLPDEEKAYLALYKVHNLLRGYYLNMGDNPEADKERSISEKILKDAIESKKFAAVQCCLKYADILFDQQKCMEVIDICQQAVQYAESQPSARIGYFLYLSGQSKDILIHRDSAFMDSERVQDALSDYVAAYQNDISPTYKNNIRNRVILLCAKSGLKIPAVFSQEDNISALLESLQTASK